MYQLVKQRLKQFTACTNGNVAAFFGLAAVPLLVATGGAIDYARYSEIRQQVAVALDAGVLAAAASLNEDTDVTEADIAAAKIRGLDQYNATLGNVEGIELQPPVFDQNHTEDGIEATVTGVFQNHFLMFAGVSEFDLNLSAESVYGHSTVVGSDLEVSMMLDVTGSMCNDNSGPCTDDRKISALKTAAKLLVDKVVWADQSTNTAKVALVPFSSRVRLAPDGEPNAMFTAATNLPANWSGYVRGTETVQTGTQCTLWNGYWTGSGRNRRWVETTCAQESPVYATVTTGVWEENLAEARPCVTERHYVASNGSVSYDATDDAPGAGKWMNGNDGTRRLESMDSSDTPITANGKTKPNYISPNGSGTYSSLNGNYSTGNATCSQIQNTNVLMPLSNDKIALKNRIDDLSASGFTSGALGTAWSWYAISPKWASFWGTDSAPQPYALMEELNEGGKQKLYKVAVLMTDGEYNYARGASANTSTVNPAALALCTGMKNEGVEVYTIGFETSANANSLLTSCATSEDHFYPASNAEALEEAFKDIGDRVLSVAGQEIRLAR